MLGELSMQAQADPRRRRHLNLHASHAEPCQRLINAVEPDSYIRPHRHAAYATNETLIALRGRFAYLEFDDAGEVSLVRIIAADGNVVVAEIAPTCWHTVIALGPGSVLFETKSGPFDPAAAKDFAPFAPPEGDPAASAYLEQLRRHALSLA